MCNETESYHSTYCNDVKLKNMLDCSNSEISILNINVHFDKLKLFLSAIDKYSQITSLTLQETWFNDEVDYFSIPAYNL